jgi:hypothetical protein
MPVKYSGPGDYVAICNQANFDGHYVKTFSIPDTGSYTNTEAGWYFLNRVDHVACLEAVYPRKIFVGPLLRVLIKEVES